MSNMIEVRETIPASDKTGADAQPELVIRGEVPWENLTPHERARYVKCGSEPDLEEPKMESIPTFDEFEQVIAALKDERVRLRSSVRAKDELKGRINKVSKAITAVRKLADRLYSVKPDGRRYVSADNGESMQADFINTKRWNEAGWKIIEKGPISHAHDIVYAAMYHTMNSHGIRTAVMAEDAEKAVLEVSIENSCEWSARSPHSPHRSMYDAGN